MYAAAVLFIVVKAFEAPDETTRFFTVPAGSSGNPRFAYTRKDAFFCGLAFLISAVYLLALHNKEIPDLDEGWILALSNRVLHGDLPYKDFFMLMAPGAIYLNAWIFQLFGTSIMVERLAAVILGSLGASAVYLLARLGMGFFFSMTASLLYLTWQFPFFFQASYSWYAVVSMILAYLLMGLTVYNREGHFRKLFLVGALCGTSFLFKQNIGALAFIGCVLYYLAERAFLDRETRRGLLFPLFPSPFGKADAALLTKRYTVMLVGFAIPLGVCAYGFLSKGYATEFVQGVFINPMTKTTEFLTPYQPMSKLTDKRVMMYMPHFTMLLTLWSLLVKFRRKSMESRDRFVLLLLIATGTCVLTTYPRADFVHIAFALWPSLVLLAYWTQRGVESIARKWLGLTRVFPFASSFDFRLRNLAVAFLACLPLTIFVIHRTEKNLVLEKDLLEVEAPRGRGIYGGHWQVTELNDLMKFIEEHSASDGPERIFSTDPLVYFLTDQRNPTPYDYVIAGNGPIGFERDIIESLQRHKPRMVVIDRIFTDYYPVSPQWHTVEKHIYENYELVRDAFRYEVLLLPDGVGEAMQEGATGGEIKRVQEIETSEQGRAL